jgi:hypothetical protein
MHAKIWMRTRPDESNSIARALPARTGIHRGEADPLFVDADSKQSAPLQANRQEDEFTGKPTCGLIDINGCDQSVVVDMMHDTSDTGHTNGMR